MADIDINNVDSRIQDWSFKTVMLCLLRTVTLNQSDI